MRRVYRIIGRQTPSTGSIFAGQGAQLAPDRGLTPHRTGGFAASEYSGESELEEILQHSDYLMELRTNQPEDWLKIATQAAWNSGRPLIPLRDTQSLQEARKWITVHSISE